MKLTKEIIEVLKYHGYITITFPTEDILKVYDNVEDFGYAGYINDRGAIDFLKTIFDENGVNRSSEVGEAELEKQAEVIEPEVIEPEVIEPEVIEPEVMNPETVDPGIVDEPVVDHTSVETETPEFEQEKVEEKVETITPESESENPIEEKEYVVEEAPAEDQKSKPKKTTKKITKKES